MNREKSYSHFTVTSTKKTPSSKALDHKNKAPNQKVEIKKKSGKKSVQNDSPSNDQSR